MPPFALFFCLYKIFLLMLKCVQIRKDLMSNSPISAVGMFILVLVCLELGRCRTCEFFIRRNAILCIALEVVFSSIGLFFLY